jgi:hypothetical protein
MISRMPPPPGPALPLRAVLLFAAGLSACSSGALDVIDLDPVSATNDLVAHWSFDEGAGNVVVDSSGNDHNGQLAGGTTWIPGRFGTALHFDAGEVRVDAFPQPGMASWSVLAWLRSPRDLTTGTTYATIISNELLRSGGWQMNIRTTVAPAIYQFAYWKGPTEDDNVFQNYEQVLPDQWVHIAGVYDKNSRTISIYRNGQPVMKNGLAVSEPADASIKQGTTTLYLARWPPESAAAGQDPGEERRLTGDLDEIAVYNRALDAKEVAALARAPIPQRP